MDFLIYLLTCIAVALSLSADSFVVSLVAGLSSENHKIRKEALKIASVLALYQSLFFISGWFLGTKINTLIKSYDHWIAFVLLAFIGYRMICSKGSETKKLTFPLNFTILSLMGIATSIDALVLGAGLGLIKTPVLLHTITIFIITFFASVTGIFIGKKTGAKFRDKVEAAGGIILIILGFKILLEHLSDHSVIM